MPKENIHESKPNKLVNPEDQVRSEDIAGQPAVDFGDVLFDSILAELGEGSGDGGF